LNEIEAPRPASASAIARASRVFVPSRIRLPVAALMDEPSGSLRLDAGTAICTWMVGERCSSSTSSSMPFFRRLSLGFGNLTLRISLETGALFFNWTPVKSVGCCARGAS
jgi:hypothetical protein